MNKDNKEGQEDFILKKIRHYQGTIADYETFWKQKIAQGESEISDETKSCKDKNADLNKAFEIVPVSQDDDTPKPISKEEIEKEEKEEKDDKKEKSEKKEDKKDKKDKKDK